MKELIEMINEEDEIMELSLESVIEYSDKEYAIMSENDELVHVFEIIEGDDEDTYKYVDNEELAKKIFEIYLDEEGGGYNE